jgi:predicted O-linked N-acetylglucosamine transferase (SPINDLY family)
MSRADPTGRILQSALLSYRQGNWREAEKYCRAALRTVPQHPGVLQMLGVVLMRQGRPQSAVEFFDRLLKLQPSLPDVWNNRGHALQDIGRVPEALASYDRALALRPGYAEALNNRAQLLMAHRRYEEAAQTFARLMEADPRAPYMPGSLLAARMNCCDWTDFAALHDAVEKRIAAGEPGEHPISLLWHSLSPTLQLRSAEIYAQRELPKPARAVGTRPSSRGSRIRLAYLSGDFCDHPMAYMFADLFERHDRARFETFAFSYGPDDGGEMRPRLRKAFDRFVDIRTVGDEEAAEQIRGERIDLLVDLAGYTTGNRAGILAFRPAALQVSFHGFGMGAPFMDYLISDPQVTPDELKAGFCEKIVRLPDCWIFTDTSHALPAEIPDRTAAGLPPSGFVFCAFNTLHKVTPQLFEVWMRLLAEVEDSVLWMRKESDVMIRNLRREAGRCGVAGDRLIFAERMPIGVHLARHQLADLFLDTFPYGAQTTGSHALWAGLPVLTIRGQTATSRICASILHAAGLSGLIVDSLGDYEARALQLARHPVELAAIREKVRACRGSVLFDSVRHRRHVETAYMLMHERHCRGEAPQAFDVPVLS